MKYKYKWLLALLPAVLLSSCAEDVFEPYSVEEPASLVELQYLKEYQVLKDYAGSLKLGAVVNASEYAKKGAVYGLTKTNFHEVSGGIGTMHQSLTRDNGGVNIGGLVDLLNTAKSAEQTIFGSALMSTFHQNGTYLNSVIADKQDPNNEPKKTEVKKHDDAHCIRVQVTKMVEQPWDNQFWLSFTDNPANGGENWECTMDVRADNEASIGTQIHQEPSDYIYYVGIGNIDFTTEWKQIKLSGTFSKPDDWGDNKDKKIKSIALNLNDYAEANNYYFKNISFKINGTEVIKNNDCESDDASSYVSKELGNGQMHASELVKGYDYIVLDYAPMEVEMTYSKPCVVVTTSDMQANPWDSQFWIVSNQDFHPGDSYEVSMKIRADKEASAETQVHNGIGGYQHFAAIGVVDFKTDWTVYTAKGNFADPFQTGGTVANAIAFNLNTFKEANKYYFASISLKINGKEVVVNGDFTGSENSSFVAKEYPASDGTACKILPSVKYILQKDTPGIPLTDEERYAALNNALKTYIQGIMSANEGYIKSWDVVGDVLADNGISFLEAADAKTDFNWNSDNNLGELDFVRLAVKYAREYFAENGGNASDLKLFVNESGLDNEAKLQGLISWINKWESDQTTKIDGISANIKATYSENAIDLEATKVKIEEMLKGLAATGRSIRIAGIDLNYVDDAGVEVATSVMTVDQAKKMGELYSFIVKKYKELIPDSQRYGIFVSNITDNGDTPNGLWNAKYSRKPQYGGFADGLK